MIDEPENHLHPKLQQSVLPNLLRAFPDVQFIVATHAPLVVTSVQDASVYVFRYLRNTDAVVDQRYAIVSEQLSTIDKAASANDILRDVLGLEYTMPEWAAKELHDGIAAARDGGFTRDAMSALEQRLRSQGLAGYIGDAFHRIVSDEG